MRKRHWDIRGMNLDQVMAVSAAALDETFEEMVDNAGNLCRDHGGTEDEIESMREWQRQRLTEGRDEQLAKLRAWLERGCESLN
jgi:hypothetical protein